MEQRDASGRPPIVLVLRPGVCVHSLEHLMWLDEAVAARLADAEDLAKARRPASTADAYRAAHALASVRCDEDLPSSTPLPTALATVASGQSYMQLGQVLRAIPKNHRLASSAPGAALAAFETAVKRMEQQTAPDTTQLLFTLIIQGHTHLSLQGKEHRMGAVRSFMAASRVDPASIAAAASTGRALVLLNRQHQRVGSVQSNHTLQLAVAAFHRMMLLLEAQRTPYTARRDGKHLQSSNTCVASLLIPW
jgi:hypothetical protein